MTRSLLLAALLALALTACKKEVTEVVVPAPEMAAPAPAAEMAAPAPAAEPMPAAPMEEKK